MNHRLTWLALLVALAACDSDKTAGPQQYPQADVKAPVIPAAEEPGETESFTDPVFGISITYPKRLHFVRDPGLTRRVRAATKGLSGLTKEGRELMQASNIGIQFFILKHAMDAGVAFNPSLNVVTEKVPAEAGIKTTQQYVALALRVLRNAVKDAKSAGEPTETTLDGRTWIRTMTYGTLGGNELLFVHHMHFDPEPQIAYAVTITNTADGDLKDIATFEQVAKTVRIKR